MRIITELAWHSLFAHQLLIRPDADQLKHFKPTYTIIALPGFKAKPSIHGTFCLGMVGFTILALRPPQFLVDLGHQGDWGEMALIVWPGTMSIGAAWFGANAYATPEGSAAVTMCGIAWQRQ